MVPVVVEGESLWFICIFVQCLGLARCALTLVVRNLPHDSNGRRSSPGTDRGWCCNVTELQQRFLSGSGPSLGWNHQPSTIRSSGHGLTATYRLNDSLTFKSITAYREYDEDVYSDLSAATDRSTAFFNDHRMTVQDQFSQEFQLLGGTDNLNYVAGLFYFRERAREDVDSVPQLGTPVSGIGSAFTRDVMGWTSIDSKSYALYAQVSYVPDILDQRLEFTVGGRYSIDEKSAEKWELQSDYFLGSPTSSNLIEGSPSERFSNFSPSFNVKYKFTDEVNAYFKVATAYKAGGFNSRAVSSASFNGGFDEESLVSYEIGLKSELFDRRVRLNMAACYADFKDVQVTVRQLGSPTATDVLNAGKEAHSGFELELLALVTDSLTVSANYGYLETEIKEIIEEGRNVADQFVSINAPRHSGSLTVEYNFGELLSGDMILSLTGTYMDSKYFNPRWRPAKAGSYADSYSLLNANLQLFQLDLKQGVLEASLWGNNLTDKEYVVGAFGEFSTSDRMLIWGEPRSYGLDLKYTF